MIQKCRIYGLKYIFLSDLVYRKTIHIQILERIHKRLVRLCNKTNVNFVYEIPLSHIFEISSIFNEKPGISIENLGF